MSWFFITNINSAIHKIRLLLDQMILGTNKYKGLWLLILLWCIYSVQCNWILSVSQSSSIVNTNNTLNVLVRTSTAIPVNTLRLILPSSFQVYSSTCTINNLTNSCILTTNSTTQEKEIVYTFSFLTNTQYFLGIGVRNPAYSDNFQLRANNGAIAFATTGLVFIEAKQVVCRIQGQSSVVGERTIGLLSIQNDPTPLNSQISIKTNSQTLFRNIFNSGPSCNFRNITLPCSLSTIFSQQILQIRSLPQLQNLALNSLQINSINNPPFNNTFSTLQLEIQDSLGYPMQKCTFQQSRPSVLQQVRNVIVTGWNNRTGQESNVSVSVSTTFTTLVGQSVLMVVPSLWRWTPSSPAIVQSTSTSGSQTRFLLTNLTLTSSSILFNANIVNPGFVSGLNVEIYVLFNETNFRQEYRFPTQFWVLEPYTTSISYTLTSNQTYATTKGTYLFSEKGNLTFDSQYFVDKTQTGGVSLQLKLTLGRFLCSDMTASLISSLSPIVVSSCADSQLQVFVDASLLAKIYWITFPVLNHFSTQANSIAFTLSTKSGSFLITSGSTVISLQKGQISFQVTNTNPKLFSPSSLQMKQSQQYTELNYLNYLGLRVRRTIRLVPPQNLIFSNSTTIQSLEPSLCQIISTTQLSLSSIIIVIEGYLSVSLNNIVNPNNYLIGNFFSISGDRNWNLQVSDRFGNPSGTGSALQMPEYQGVEGKFTYSLVNKTIEQTSSMTVLVDPQLVYSQTINANQIPQVIVTLSDSQFTRIITCPTTNCSIMSQKKISYKLTASFVGPLVIQVKNSLLPTPISQQISVQIRLGNFLYESSQKTYTLEPMALEAVSGFAGLFGEIGIITVNLTTTPSRSDYTLLYSGQGTMLQSSTCDNCNSSTLRIRGRVKYFQKSNLSIIAKSTINGTQITYAQLTTQIRYTCIAIQGCRICANQTSSSNVTTLVCQKCFDKSLSNFNLLYERRCVDACPIQTYADEVNCKSCPQNCYNCSDSVNCLQCVPEYFVYMQTCVMACPADYTKNSTHCLPRQIICPENCINCPQDNMCEQCQPTYKLFKDTCYSQCPSGYVASKFNSTTCQLFIPPQQAKYFPFAFVICSILFLIVLIIIKCFERRSLVVGNFISLLSILEFGSFLMTLVYTLTYVQLNLFIQALLFVIILSKVLINLTFLLYFIKNIRGEKEFSQWLEKYPQNYWIYSVALTLSTMISFNIIRIIYSRFMGLRMFFGRFSSGLIFKPINFFSIALSLIYSAPLIALCLHDIELQNGYKTKIFYSAIETIIMQAIILMSWIIDWNRGKTDEFFDYQVYKVSNIQDQSSINPIGIGQQHEVGGSTQQFLKSYRKMPKSLGSSLREWQRKNTIPFSQGAVSIDSEQNEKLPQGLLAEKDEDPQSLENKFTKRKSLFKIKILNQWRQLQNKLPNSNSKLKIKKNSRQYISKSPQGKLTKKNKRQKKLKKNASLDKIEIKFLDPTRLQKIQRLRQYFHKVSEAGENVENNRSIISSVKEKEKSPKDDKSQKLNVQEKIGIQVLTQSQNSARVLINNYLQDSLEANSKKQIEPIMQLNQEKSLRNQDQGVVLQRIQRQQNYELEQAQKNRQQKYLQNMLDEEWTQNKDQKGGKQQMANVQPCFEDEGINVNFHKVLQQQQQYEFVENSQQPAQSNRQLKNSAFTKSTSAKANLFNSSQPQTCQHRYNNLARPKEVRISQSFKNVNNKSRNVTNSMDVSLPKAIFESHQISEDCHILAQTPEQQVMNMTGPNFEQKEEEVQERVIKKKKKRKDKLIRLSKAEQEIQKRYLQRMKSTEGRKSSSQAKKYRDLSDF